MVSLVQGSPSPQLEGQLAGGSQVSLGSMTPSPQLAEQSASVALVHPEGQQPSPAAHDVMGVVLQAALQLAALPVSVSLVQELESSQLVGQLAGGSQVSPGSTVPSPHVCEQSASVEGPHPAGQQPSAPPHSVMEL